jgi:cytochrome c biogenesis protein CcmG/thiol:disulfide interchange protein DsbE
MAPPSKSKQPYRPPANRNTGMTIVIGVAVVAVLALAIAVIVAAMGGDDGADVPAGTQQTWPVVVEGAPLPSDPGGGSDPAVGMTPPRLEGRSFDGSSVVIDPEDGTPKVVVFLAHWCPHCQAEVPRIVDWQQAGVLPAGVEVYGVSTSVSDNQPNYPPSAWLAREGWTFPTLADDAEGDAGAAWGLRSFPYFVALNGQGQVVARASGELNQEQFVALMEATLS